MIPYGRQNISESDIAAVVETLRSDWLTQGPKIPAFEKKLADYCEVPHAIAMSSCTAALHAACVALGVKPGDRVWTSPISFVASANCARLCGATVDFVDIDPVTRNISIELLSRKLFAAKKNNCLPRVIVAVHFAGNLCDMFSIFALAKEYKIKIIEDAAHAIGGEYLEKKVGYCEFSDITTFSFHPVKTLTTGEGGAATTRNDTLALAMRRFISHGITRDPDYLEQSDQGAWYYEQQTLGLNYRMCDIQAALGIAQMDRLEEFVGKRRDLVQRYMEKLSRLPLRLPRPNPLSYPGWHIFPIELINADRRKVFDYMRQQNIAVNVHYIPIHLQPYYRELGFSRGDFINSENYYAKALTLPLFPDLTEEQQDYVIEKLTLALRS